MSYRFSLETILTELKSQRERIERATVTLESARGGLPIRVGIHSLKHLHLTRRTHESY